MSDRYVLIDGKVKLEPDLEKWGKWLETDDRKIELTEGDEYVVSTVFLGLDHAFGRGPPLLFETMVFTRVDWGALAMGLSDQDMIRYSTLEEAKVGHVEMVKKWIGTVPAKAKPDAEH